MKIQLLRNATLIIDINSNRILFDPMLSGKHELGPFPYINDIRSNPLVDLPMSQSSINELISDLDAVLISHLHPDHWDFVVQDVLPKSIPVFCQPGDKQAIAKSGFINIEEIKDHVDIFGISIYRTDGKHGTGEIGNIMGKVSGYVISTDSETIYIAGDTIWCDEVKETIDRFQPDRIIINGGGAQFSIGGHVTMNLSDLSLIHEYYPSAKYCIVHLEAVTPAIESRKTIKNYLTEKGIVDRFIIPDDGDFLFI